MVSFLQGFGHEPARQAENHRCNTGRIRQPRWTLLRQAIECWSKVLQFCDSPDTAVAKEARQRLQKLESEAIGSSRR
jgi:hypothetical protein